MMMMRTTMIAALACTAMGLQPIVAHAGEIDAGLEEVLANTREGQVVSSLVYLWEQADVDALVAELDADRASFARRNEEVVRLLQDTAELSQRDLLVELERLKAAGEVEDFQAYWISNIIRVDAAENVLRQLAERDDVQIIYYNIPISNITPVEDGADVLGGGEQGSEGGVASGPEPGVEAVRAPEVWAMGFTGQGVLVATIDTGVSGNHPALGSRWRGLDPQYAGNPQWAWFDPITNTTFPTEFGGGAGHGTHTMGTVLGGAPGDQIGVAPGATYIHAGVVDRGGINNTIANIILSFQWMAAPTGNPGDSWAVPRVCSNSWGTLAGHGHPACDQTFWQWVDNSEAAGTIQLFSAGNEGPGSNTLRRPADRAQKDGQTSDYHSVAVGAIDPYNPNWPIANFSSRGPSNCTPDGTPFIKPNISAPGVNTRSAHQNGGYAQLSGTSMASPHINGVVALMIEACDVLSADDVKQIIYDTAFDLGAAGKDNVYGWGMIDAYEAVNMAIGQCSIGIKLPNGAPTMMDPGEPKTFLVEVVEGTESVVPGSEFLFYRFDGGAYISVPLVPLGGGLYDATIPGPACDDNVEFYVQIEGDAGTIRTSPSNAPQSVYSALVGHFETTEVYYQDFSQGLPGGWSQSGLWHITNSCPRGGSCAPGPQYAYYGKSSAPNVCTYNTGGTNSGQMLSQQIAFPQVAAGESIALKFCYNLETEGHPSYDIATFRVQNTGIEQRMAEASNWTQFSIDVTSLSGQSRTLQWHFNTVDGLYNDYRGWQVDRVRIEVTGLVCDDVPCAPADLNCDGSVGVADLLILLSEWGQCADCNACPADLDGNCNVGVSDLLILLADWG